MRNKALTVPFVLWAMIFIVVPLVMIGWYGVTVEEPIPYTEIMLEDGSVIYELEDGSHTTEKPWQKRAVFSLSNVSYSICTSTSSISAIHCTEGLFSAIIFTAFTMSVRLLSPKDIIGECKCFMYCFISCFIGFINWTKATNSIK